MFENFEGDWIGEPSMKALLTEQFWKIVRYFRTEEYNEWATSLMTFYENLLYIRALSFLGHTQFRNRSFERTLHDSLKKLSQSADGFHGDSFFSNRKKYPDRGTYQKIVLAFAPDSLLAETSVFVKKLEKLHDERNGYIHESGGLSLTKIKEVFGSMVWERLLKQLLEEEFKIQIMEEPLLGIHHGLIDWIQQSLRSAR